MQRWGTTVAGSVRWFCRPCQKSATRSRPDIARRARHALFVRWVTGTRSLEDLAAVYRVSRWTLTCWFRPFWRCCPWPIVPQSVAVLIVDGLYLAARSHCVLIGKTPEAVVFWLFVERETYGSWRLFCQHLPAPRVVVCDGQRGMRAAIRDCWPRTRVQRCVVHVFQLTVARLTRRPKLLQGKRSPLSSKRFFGCARDGRSGDGSDGIAAGACSTTDSSKSVPRDNFPAGNAPGGIPIGDFGLCGHSSIMHSRICSPTWATLRFPEARTMLREASTAD